MVEKQGNSKGAFLNFRVTDVALATVALAARAAGTSMSELARDAVLEAAKRELAAAGALGPER